MGDDIRFESLDFWQALVSDGCDGDNLQRIREAATVGDPGAQVALGQILLDEDGSRDEAAIWFLKSADAGDSEGQFSIGWCYHAGRGVEEDNLKAVSWLEKASTQGHARAHSFLGFMYAGCAQEPANVDSVDDDEWPGCEYKDVSLDPEKAVEHMLASDDESWAKYWLARKSGSQYTEILEREAQTGDPTAQRVLGIKYLYGAGATQNTKTGAGWLQKSAEQGDVTSQVTLGNLYFSGDELEQDDDLAIHWYNKAATQDDPRGHNALAGVYYEGRGGGKDIKKVIHHMYLAEKLGDADAGERLVAIGFEDPEAYKHETGKDFWEEYDQRTAVEIGEAESDAKAEQESPGWSRFIWSLVGFGLLGYFTFASSLPTFTDKILWVCLIAGIIFFHELGHYLAMMISGYKNTQIMFMPFGGLATGRPDVIDARKQFIVLIMGPLPGLLLGMYLLQNLHWGEWAMQLGVMLLIINAINLLPIHPLDGGQIWDYLVFSRLPALKSWFFILGALVATIYLGNDLLQMFTDEIDDTWGDYLWTFMFIWIALSFLKGSIINRRMTGIVGKSTLAFSSSEVNDSGGLPKEIETAHVKKIRNCLAGGRLGTDPDFAQHHEAVRRTWFERFKPAGVLMSIILFAVYLGAFYPVYWWNANVDLPLEKAEQYQQLGDESIGKDPDKAIEYYEKELAISLKILGPENLRVGRCYYDLGIVYREKGEYDRAIGYLEKGLAISLKAHGPEHLDVGVTYSSLGIAYREKGESDRAIEYLEKSLAIRLKALGPEHLDVGKSYHHLGRAYAQKGDKAKGMGYLLKAKEIYIKSLGPDHPRTKDVQSWIDKYK